MSIEYVGRRQLKIEISGRALHRLHYNRLHNIGKIEILEIMFLDVITCGDDENDV